MKFNAKKWCKMNAIEITQLPYDYDLSAIGVDSRRIMKMH